MPPDHPIPDSYWVVRGSLLAGAYPGANSEARAREKLSRLLDAGIRSFVNLTQEIEPLAPYEPLLAELARARLIDCRHVRYAIRDLGVPSAAMLVQILTTIDEEIASGRPVYVHCWGGIGRTGTIVGCFIVRDGCSATDAIRRIAELRAPTPDGSQASPETDEQRQVIVRMAGLQAKGNR